SNEQSAANLSSAAKHVLDSFQKQILLQAIKAGRCVLYTGAGASATAKSKKGHSLPNSRELASLLWEFSGLDPAAFSNQDLQNVFDHAVTAKGERAVMQLLDDRLTVTSAPVGLYPITE